MGRDYRHLTNPNKGHLIIHPIMTGGLVPLDVLKRLNEEDWIRVGYSACFDCVEGRSGLITKPPVGEFQEELAEFFGGDVAEHTFGCRAAQFGVMKAVGDYIDGEGQSQYAKVVVADPLCHYTTAIAGEMVGFTLAEASHTGYPEYRVEAEGFVRKIEEVKRQKGRLPGLLVATHADPYYGNLAPIAEVGKIAKEYEIPFMVNAAYTGGVLPLNMREMGADFLTVSAHKSMASMGPLGFLVTSFEWAKKAFQPSKLVADWSGRVFGKKIPLLFGCSIGATPLISSMLSFPHVKERVGGWEGEMGKVNRFVEGMEKIDDLMLIGERPHRHHLLHFETPLFWEISKRHKRKGFFLAEELEKRGIIGVHKGLSKHIKLSIYGLGSEEVERVLGAFREIAEKYTKQYDLAPITTEK